jgi:hypothetical protein
VLLHADMARRRRTPQEKKRLSRARDNLSTTGEAPHALRNHWKKKKRSAERARRTAERIALEVRPGEFAPVRRRTVRKWGWPRLGEAIAAKLEARTDQTPRKSAAARERRRLRRGSKRRNAKAP